MDCALEGPFFNLLCQAFSNRIFLNVKPFPRIILVFPQAVMPAARLKHPFLVFMPPMEIPFPKSDPLFNGECQLTRRAKKVQMVGHQQIIPDQPGSRRKPCLSQKLMRRSICQPRRALFCRDGEENDVWPAKLDQHSARRIFSSDLCIYICRTHISKKFIAIFLGSTESRPTKNIIRSSTPPPGPSAPRARRAGNRKSPRSSPRPAPR